MKATKLLRSLMTVMLLALLLPQTAAAYDFMVNGIAYKKNSDGQSVSVTSTGTNPNYDGVTNLNIPATVTYGGKTYSVTAIGYYGLAGAITVVSLNLPEGLVSIGECGLNNMAALRQLTLPSTLRTVAGWAFENLTSVQSITSLATTAPTTSGYWFHNTEVLPTCPFYVPSGSLSSYQASTYWRAFNLVESIVLATSVSLNYTSTTLLPGETLQLTATVLPSNTTNKAVTWKSSNTSVATVDNNGKVTGKSSGYTIITATTTDGTNLSASCVVTVQMTNILLGDLNNDGVIDIADVNIVLNYMLGKSDPRATYEQCDLNEDGVIDITDVNIVLNLMLGKAVNIVKTYTVNGVSFKMISVTGGKFTMGATSEQGNSYYSDELPTHQVTLSNYDIGQTEVTQALWQAVMGSNPSNHTGNLEYPVENVTWNDCQVFITKLNEMTGKNFRLPTEAEWEYAARGGCKSLGFKFAGSNNANDVAWSSCGSTHAVAQKQPNELNIYDMSGNVEEFCYDWYGPYSSDDQINPTGPTSGTIHVDRGGSYISSSNDCRVSRRDNGNSPTGHPSGPDPDLGFRLALGNGIVIPQEIPQEYTKVDWIESQNTNSGFSYINSGYTPSINTRIEFKTMLPKDRSLNTHYGNYSLFGAHSWTRRSGMYGYGGSLCFEINGSIRNDNISSDNAILNEQGDFLFREGLQIHASECSEVYPQNWLHIDNFASNDNNDHVFEGNISINSMYLQHNGNKLLDWQPTTYWNGLDGTDATCSVLYLFTGVWEPNLYAIDNGQPRGFITQRLYEFKIYESDVLVYNYIPVMRKQDNVYGLYDSVNKTFLTSPNGVSFTGGND